MRRSFIVALALGAAVASGCRDPTQITLTLHTNAECGDVAGTAISVGGPTEVENLAPVATTSTCIPDPEGGDIGSLVLVPANADDAAVGVKVTLSVGDDVESCLSPPYDDCIVARRLLRYIAHTPLTLPVELSLACKGEFCGPETTCVEGRCVDANVDPNECLEPTGCEPAGGAGGTGGAGGGGGEGGGGGGEPALCGTPETSIPQQISNQSFQTRVHVTLAADPSTCEWGVAWGEGTSACVQRMDQEGKAKGVASCQELPNTVEDVAVAPLGGGVFAAAGWSTEAATARLWTASDDPFTLTEPIQHADVVSGALASQGDSLVMLSEHLDGSLRYVTFAWTSTLTPGSTGLIGPLGRRPHVAWSGDDLMVSWLATGMGPGNQSGGYVARLTNGDWNIPVSEAISADSVSEIHFANRPSDDVTGVIFLDSGFAAEVWTWGPSGFSAGGYAANDYSGTSTSFGIANTGAGWVVAFVDDGKAWLTPYDADAKSISSQVEIAPAAVSVGVAAIGDQLAVGWIDDSGNIRFRMLRADLAGL